MSFTIGDNLGDNFSNKEYGFFKIRISRTFVIAAILHLFVASLFICPYIKKETTKYYNIGLAKSQHSIRGVKNYSVSVENAKIEDIKTKKINNKSKHGVDKHVDSKNINKITGNNQNNASQVFYKIGSVNNPSPIYPRFAIENMQQGVVKIGVVVNLSGKVLSAVVEKSSGYKILDEAALLAIQNWIFDVKISDNYTREQGVFNVVVPIKFAITD